MDMKKILQDAVTQFYADFDNLMASDKPEFDRELFLKKYLDKGIMFALHEIKHVTLSKSEYKEVVSYVEELETCENWYVLEEEIRRLMIEDEEFNTFMKSPKEKRVSTSERVRCLLIKILARGMNIVFQNLINKFLRENMVVADIVELTIERLKMLDTTKEIFERGICGLSVSAYDATK